MQMMSRWFMIGGINKQLVKGGQNWDEKGN